MQRPYENKAGSADQSERGAVKAPCRAPVCHFRVARDDRDGRARYSVLRQIAVFSAFAKQGGTASIFRRP